MATLRDEVLSKTIECYQSVEGHLEKFLAFLQTQPQDHPTTVFAKQSCSRFAEETAVTPEETPGFSPSL